MRVRALDVNNDWTFGRGQNDYKRDLQAVAQDIQTNLSSFLGDCFFDLGSGIDWFNLLGGKDLVALNLAVSAAILNTQNVTGLLQLSVVVTPERLLVVTYQVQTTYSILGGNFQFDLNGVQ